MCNICTPSRSFSNQDALFQHTIAKHSSQSTTSNTSINLECDENEVAKIEEKKQGEELVQFQEECPICGVILSSSTLSSTLPSTSSSLLEQHLQQIIPPIQLTFECKSCPKIFHSERSLLQHSKFCL